ncbi:hypothetical protein F5148DRAFT_1158100 [Russula earlei]|uniref:Uncharacterized protein n=1 Tax=Russula earlei TaxID=71964 RepID=A0ACC0UP93_9AGAM|nr:hypothetical protein F5148DRAFT_1158100 [Russula earlei]
MRTTAVFAILCLAIPSFASSSNSSGRSPKAILRGGGRTIRRGSGGGVGVAHPAYKLALGVRPGRVGVPPKIWHMDPREFPIHPVYNTQEWGYHPAQLHVPYKDWTTHPAQIPTNPDYQQLFHRHPAQLGILHEDWGADPAKWGVHPGYSAHPGTLGFPVRFWNADPQLVFGMPPPPAEGGIQPEPRQQPTPPPGAR